MDRTPDVCHVVCVSVDVCALCKCVQHVELNLLSWHSVVGSRSQFDLLLILDVVPPSLVKPIRNKTTKLKLTVSGEEINLNIMNVYNTLHEEDIFKLTTKTKTLLVFTCHIPS